MGDGWRKDPIYSTVVGFFPGYVIVSDCYLWVAMEAVDLGWWKPKTREHPNFNEGPLKKEVTDIYKSSKPTYKDVVEIKDTLVHEPAVSRALLVGLRGSPAFK